MESLNLVLEQIDKLMWGKGLMILLFATGLVLTFRLKGIQFRKMGKALKMTFSKKSLKADKEEGDITPFQALTTTLAATVGNGNIAGVATAITLGGPGALFWMWVTAFFGMATRVTEAMLGLKFRKKAADGTYIGGAFYYLEDGASGKLGKKLSKFLAIAFAVAGMAAAFGIGNMVQSNSVSLSLSSLIGIGAEHKLLFNIIIGIVLAAITAVVIVGGIREIGKVTEKVVPLMAVIYIVGAIIVIAINIEAVPNAFKLIFKSAFSGHAAVGGFAGATIMKAIQYGVARGIFSNESGLGTGSLAHSAAKNAEPAKQGMVAMVGTFIDTLIVCTLTGLTIVLSGLWTTKGLTSTALTMSAFNSAIPGFGGGIVAVCSILFGYSTIIGWYYYGEQCTEYLWGTNSNKPYKALFIIGIFLGAVAKISIVWTISDILNGFMAIPNLIGLLVLSGVAAKEMNKWLNSKKQVQNSTQKL